MQDDPLLFQIGADGVGAGEVFFLAGLFAPGDLFFDIGGQRARVALAQDPQDRVQLLDVSENRGGFFPVQARSGAG